MLTRQAAQTFDRRGLVRRGVVATIAVALLLTSLVAADDGRNKKKGAASDAKSLRTSELPTIRLVGGQALVGKLAESHVSVQTRYGRLKVPMTDVVRMRLRPRLSAEGEARAREILAGLVAAGESDADDEAFIAALTAIGPGAYWLLSDATRSTENDAVKDAIESVLTELRAIEDVYLEKDDEIATVRFTIRGQLVQEAFHVERFGSVLTLPRSDVIELAWGELEVRKVFKVTGQHSEGSNRFLDTGLEVKKGRKFTLKPSGSMTWQGQSFGPGGISNHTWNSRRMGCLQWRVGKGSWTVLSEDFEGKADSAGVLQFCVHLTGAAGSGEFKVEYRATKK